MQETVIKDLPIDEDTGRAKYCGRVYSKRSKLYINLVVEFRSYVEMSYHKEAITSDKVDSICCYFNMTPKGTLVYPKSKVGTNALIRAIKLGSINEGDKILLKAIISQTESGYYRSIYKLERFIKFDYINSDDNFHK